MSRRYFQTLPDDIAALVDARRGMLSIQQFTTMAILAMCQDLPLAQRVEAIERQLRVAPAQPPPPKADGMLSFD